VVGALLALWKKIHKSTLYFNAPMNKKASLFIKTMKSKGLTLAIAESMTCGLASNTLARAIGTSEVLLGSLVCYSPLLKMSLLKVSKAEIKKYSCESKEVTKTMAVNLSKIIEADVCAAITGLASSGGSETKEKPVGTVFICVKKGKDVYQYRHRFYGTPLTINKKACNALYDFILSKI
jgi:nicotinamide-nucleotide amidase